MTAYALDTARGVLTPFQTISTLPDGYTGTNRCSKIRITPSGRFLYVPNRGHNSIACFSVAEATGRLTSQGQMPTEPVPRAIGLDPTGNFLYAAGRESGRLSAYRIDDGSGRLEFLQAYPVGKRPMWVLTLALR